MAYQQLTSMKYWRTTAMSEVALAKKQQTGRSVRAFNMFLVAYLVFIGCMYIMIHDPAWVPKALTMLEQTGITEQIKSIVVR